MSTDPHTAGRADGRRFLLGRGRYLDDLAHDAFQAAFVRSPHASALITGVDLDRARSMPGVIAAFAHPDLTGRVRDPLPVLVPHPALTAPRTARPLAAGRVRHVGEAVAMVVATDRYLAEDACARVAVGYRPLPPVVDLTESSRAQRLVHSDVSGNMAGHSVHQAGDCAAALRAAPYRLELELTVERSAPAPLEGRGALARWDDTTDTLLLHSSTQLPTGLRAAVAAILELPVSSVECVVPDTGGAFGGKLVHPTPEEVLVAWAALSLRRPVKWVEDRWENLAASSHERAQRHRVTVGFDERGRVLAIDATFLHDTGAYTPYGLVVPLVTAAQVLGPYRIPAYRIEFRSLYTNTTMVTPYRGAGRPQGTFVTERTMDAVARHLGLDRAQVRAANLVRPKDMPYEGRMPFQDGRPLVYDSGDLPAALALVQRAVGWEDFPAERAAARANGRRIGIGLACYVEGTGIGPYEGARVTVAATGRVRVAVATPCQGQSHATMLAGIVAGTLGIPPGDVTVTAGDTRALGYGAGTFASRTTVVAGNAAATAAAAVRSKALQVAARALGTAPEDLELVDGAVRRRGTTAPSLALGQIAVLSNPLRYAFDRASRAATQFAAPLDGPALPPGGTPGLDEVAYFAPPAATFADGAHAAVVETDPDTARIRVLRYCVVHDCGVVLDRDAVEGQLRGGVAQGIAGALYERLGYDRRGHPRNTSFRDFLMPGSDEIPPIRIEHIVTPSTLNPLGVKGVGEGGIIPVAAVLAAAVEDAEGIVIDSVPIRPADLFVLRGRCAGRPVRK
ncbi:aerobic carbon-monoxide dehydrogenase large subunit [Kitasatospora purpeofusca]|uniref:aerobic carbon-monoxide dehydrogenase large subunit n=1 Tax=Kitasatospora purpeofusca TaxID=67352 RepID=UPI002E165032|nr:aerobic carbon-monoxide dehydrogenase large subunit [Kitasatospora purpeofusca]WSR37926.1 aerobic carbon-monoxide dehydrogenase large subunit [Kitasatospora purpeofusca]